MERHSIDCSTGRFLYHALALPISGNYLQASCVRFVLQAVTGVVGRCELLCAMFSVLGFMAYSRLVVAMQDGENCAGVMWALLFVVREMRLMYHNCGEKLLTIHQPRAGSVLPGNFLEGNRRHARPCCGRLGSISASYGHPGVFNTPRG